MKNINNRVEAVHVLSLKYRFRITLLVLAFGFVAFSCEDFVAVDLPGDQLFAQSVFEETSTATAAMVEVYSKIRDYGLLSATSDGLPFLMANYSDDLDYYGADNLGVTPFYRNALTAPNAEVGAIWDNTYNQIYCLNAIIEGIERSKGLDEEVKKQLSGEAYFTRGLLHFTLANAFGAVPYVTSTNYKENQKISRSAVLEVYAKAKADVEQAILLLPATYLKEDRTRPNQFVAQAILARICLYQGSWDEASNAASAVLNETGIYGMETDLSKIFLSDSPTTIWQLSSWSGGSNSYEGGLFIFTSGPPPMSALTTDLLDAFEATDLRKEEWIKSVTDGTTTWYHPYKYKEDEDSESAVEKSIVIRTAELYLIRAEARVRAGNLTSGREDLNIIRQLAGLPPSTAVSENELLAAILRERRVELFTEFGHRFFDLKRFGLLDAELTSKKPGWNNTDSLFPIPQMELSLNPNLAPQNAGY